MYVPYSPPHANHRSGTKYPTKSKETWNLLESDLAQAQASAAEDEDASLTAALANLTVTRGWNTPYGRKILLNLPTDVQQLVDDGFHVSSGTPTMLKVYVQAFHSHKTRAFGIGVCWGQHKAAEYNIAERLPVRSTINQADLIAVIRALETCPHTKYPLEINCGSDYVWSTVGALHKWHDTWPPSENEDLIGHLLVLLREREMGVRFKYIRGHHLGKQAYDLARQGATLRPPTFPPQWLRPNPDTDEPKPAKQL